MGISFPANRRMPSIMRLFILITIFLFSQIVNSQFDTVQKLVGENISITCAPWYDVPNHYPILWYRKDHQLFISNDDERLSVDCKRDGDADCCPLTISSLTTDDTDIYFCVAYNIIIASVNLTVTYGQLPSEDSPVCEIYEASVEGGYAISYTNNVFKTGDEIHLRCSVYDSAIEPSLAWIREQENFTTTLTPNVTGQTLFQLVNLTEMDEGARFVCHMNHPAFSETHSCSIIPLPAPQSTSKPTIVIVGVIVIFIIAAAIVIVLAIVLMKRRDENGVIPPKPGYELTDERHGGRSIAAEYAAGSSPDSIDPSHNERRKEISTEISLSTTDQGSPEIISTTL